MTLCKRGHDKTVTGMYAGGKCKVCTKERSREWHKNNPEAAREKTKRWQEKNPQKVKANRRSEAVKRAQTNWVKKNRLKVRETNRVWARENPDKKNRLAQKRRARKKGNASVFYDRSEVFDRYDHLCGYCAAPATCLDHIVPVACGGPDAIDNVIPACLVCNAKKGAKSLLLFMTQAAIRHAWRPASPD